MTIHPLTAVDLAPPSSRRALRMAAAGFSLAWLIGLGVPVPAVELDAPAAAVLDAASGHEAATALRALLVHGIAAVALVTVALALARAATRAGQQRIARLIRATGLAAGGLSIVQFALELILAGPVASAHAAAAANTLMDAVNRIDGIKMLALAGLALAGVLAVRRVAFLPRWLGIVGAILTVALVVSGAGYGLLAPELAPAAFISLPLLLVWITGTGLALARAR